jgi:hypothetical protein
MGGRIVGPDCLVDGPVPHRVDGDLHLVVPPCPHWKEQVGMDYDKPSALPFTGAGITIGAIVIDQWWLAITAAGLIALGAVLTRVGWRRGKAPTQR